MMHHDPHYPIAIRPHTNVLPLLVAIFLLIGLTGCNEQIVHDLTEMDSNKLIARLHERNIMAEKVKQADGKWALSVDSAQTMAALTYLSENRLLNERAQTPIEKSSIISSREDQRFRYERALSREVEATILNIPGVLDARVHLNLPAVDPLFGQPLNSAPGSASVLVVSSSSDVNHADVQSLVSGASGIPASGVSVLIKLSAMPEPTVNTFSAVAQSVQLPHSAHELKQDSKDVSSSLNSIKAWLNAYWRSTLLALAVILMAVGILSFALLVRSRKQPVGARL